jgi:two-component system chemotaxis response regulator CheB
VTVLAIGSSTGGPNALARVFEGLPGDLPVPIVIVQHMPPLFTRMLAERLRATSKVHVKEAEQGDVLEPGRAYIAPGGFHMTVERQATRTILALNQDPPENSCRPAVDVLFRSVARIYGAGVLGVVMTGMGHDGARGARAIVEVGGAMYVQDAESCVVPSMPRSVSDAGLAEKIVLLDRIAPEVVARILRARPRADALQGAVS